MSAVPVIVTPAISGTSVPKNSGKPATGSAPGALDLSFMSMLLGNMMGQQAYATTSSSADSIAGTAETPVSFGTLYNMDPSMLVLPEGMNMQDLMENPGAMAGFSDQLIAALTPGLPAIAPSSGGMETNGADPRLIAAGLDPLQMQEFLNSLTSVPTKNGQVSSVPAEAFTTAGNPSPAASVSTAIPVAIITFLPDEIMPQVIGTALENSAGENFALPNMNSQAPQKVLSGQYITSQAATSPVSPLTSSADPAPATLATATAGENISGALSENKEEFDPLEFRLALKPSRYDSVMYSRPAPVTMPPVIASTAQPVLNKSSTAFQGTMPPVQSGAVMPDTVLGPAPDEQLIQADTVDTLFVPSPLAPSIMASAPTNPVLQNITASQAHPATQAAAALITKNAQAGPGTQILAVQLDPPELGKMQLKMRYEKGEPLRVHVVLEKADTMRMFQRDAHSLESALQQAGLKTDDATLSFDLAQNQNAFDQAMHDRPGSSGHGKSGWTAESPPLEIQETVMPVFTDPKTGLTHYNILA